MHVLKCAAVVAAVALFAADLRATDDGCTKDVYVFIDVSISATGNKDVFQNYAAAILAALDDDFMSRSDRVVVYIFCDRTYPVASTNSEVSVPRSDYRAVLRELSDATQYHRVLDAAPADQLKHTDFNDVYAELLRRIDPDRPQFFVIASDFLHDPRNRHCSFDAKREPEIVAMEGSAAAVSQNSGRHLVMLSRESECNLRDEVNDKVKSIPIRIRAILEKLFDAREVRTQGSPKNDAKAIREQFYTLPEPEIVEDAKRSPTLMSVRVHNKNPFTLMLKRVEILDSRNQVLGAITPNLKIPCGGSPAPEVPTSRPADNTTLTPRVEFDIGPPKSAPKPTPFARVTVSQPKLINIPDWQGGSIVLDVVLKPMLIKDSAITVRIEDDGVIVERTIPLKVTTGPEQRLLIPLELSGDDEDKLKGHSNLPVTLSMADQTAVFVDGANVTGKSISAMFDTPAVAEFNKIATPVGSLITILSAIALWRRSRLLAAIAAILGIFALVLTVIVRLTDLYQILGSSLAANIIHSTLAAIFSFFMTWTMLVLFVWPRWERQLLPHQIAVARRAQAWTAILGFTILGGLIGFFLSPLPIAFGTRIP